MPTKHIPTIVGAGVTLAVTDAVLNRQRRAKAKAKPRKAAKAKAKKKKGKKC